MITPKDIFLKRVIFEWKENLKVLKITVDWIVALYIIIPFLLWGITQYMAWWKSIPAWFNVLPLNFVFGVCFLFAWQGTVRIFILKGDQIFLLKRKNWYKKIIEYGIVYSLILNLLFSIIFFILLAPVLFLHYKFSIQQFIFLLLFVFLIKNILGLLQQFSEINFRLIKRLIISKLLLFITSFSFIFLFSSVLQNINLMIITIILMLIFILFLIIKRINLKGAIIEDIIREQNESIKLVSFLLGFTISDVKKPRIKLTRPLLFRHSTILFKERNTKNGLVEIGIKTKIRDLNHMFLYLLLVIISVLFLSPFPVHIKFIIWFALAFILNCFEIVFWNEIVSSDFIRIFLRKNVNLYTAKRKYVFLMSMPGFLLISLITGFQIYSWIGVFYFLLLGTALNFYLTKYVSLYI